MHKDKLLSKIAITPAQQSSVHISIKISEREIEHENCTATSKPNHKIVQLRFDIFIKKD